MDVNDKYEIKAMVFYRETGFMAPGKDAPMMGGATDYDERCHQWNDFMGKYERIMDKAIEETFEQMKIYGAAA